MKQLIIALILFVFVIGGAFILKPQTSYCAFCWTGKCFNSAGCGRGCVCMKKGLD